ncbi:hypothetical protein HF1_14640 [Mycoplasma haemofelis str. Langford 1]|uniref:Uncharacterized protein n=1 Tax=Mycoplasma haemofelis (strain Langford 1) TaxID=941640 RepID=E8ZK01_MYCHL|nr:hypothetical protein HF1_14640 [Mycoplasma haemofelis str. Langford 1]
MSAPYFREENEYTILGRLKVSALVRKLRDIDLLLFWTWGAPALFSFFWYVVVKGSNNLFNSFNPILAIFRSNPKFSDWGRIENLLYLTFLLGLLSTRFLNSYRILLNMRQVHKISPTFKWDNRSKVRLMLWIPFISIKIYPRIFKLGRFEVIHQYNL